MPTRPGGPLASRPLHFFWIADCSGSMKGEKIASLNESIREALPAMQKVAEENPEAQVLVRALRFSSGAQWHVAQPTPVKDFGWPDLAADGVTDMGRALTMIAAELKMPPMPERALPPVLVLLSDGQPTDDAARGLKAVLSEPWGKKAVRIAIAIGRDAEEGILQQFIGNPEIPLLRANNAAKLADMIRWASTVPLIAASRPTTDGVDTGRGPSAPYVQPNIDSSDAVW